ncbi:MAG: phosphate acetyltransferase [Verrucomicrobia bacterium]|nr:MAG: phosphate acetyltransferase [Verrucomicrobiota bacterium]
MRFIGSVIDKLQRHPKRIVFPEGAEPRIIQAARQFYSLRLGAPILLGDRTQVKEAAEQLNVSLEGVRVINPAQSEDLESFAHRYEYLRRSKGIKMHEAREAMLNPNYYGAMMVAMHQADGFVSGASEITGSTLRPLFQIIKVAPQATTASSCMVMEVEDTRFGEQGVMLLADCGVIPDPTVEQLADIAVSTAHLTRQLLNVRPRVALLSYSTKGSATHPSIGKVQAATALAQQKAEQKLLEADFDGELQVDAALIPDIAYRKVPESKVAGRANVMIFPDLNSGNIGHKLVQHLARANAYGQILLGLDRPAADVSRGSNAHDILGVAAIVGMQAIAYHQLYPGAGERLPAENRP